MDCIMDQTFTSVKQKFIRQSELNHNVPMKEMYSLSSARYGSLNAIIVQLQIRLSAECQLRQLITDIRAHRKS